MDRITSPSALWRATLAGLCANMIGIGLARFAYTPLIPALIEAGWFTPSAAAYLGAANLAGYLAGALLAQPLAARASAAAVLRAMMLLATASFIACAFPLSFSWFFLWRFASGVSGGAIMVLAAPSVLPHIPPARRGLAAGAMFVGVGIGIALSGTLVPLLMRAGLPHTWFGLAAVSGGLALLAWTGWPPAASTAPAAPAAPSATPATPVPPAPPMRARRTGRRPGLALGALYLEYGLNAVGMVPHMVFLVDYVARGQGRGLESGGWHWVLFGIGAAAGPVLAGQLADRIGFRAALRTAFVLQLLGVAALLAPFPGIGLVVSSLVVGAFTPGVVPLALGRVHELVPEERDRKRAWSLATTAYAVGQAAAAYGFSFLFDRTHDYALLFSCALGALALGLLIDLLAGAAGRAGNEISARNIRP